MITIFHQHDAPADSILVELFDRSEFLETVDMSPVAGDRLHWWTGTLETVPESSTLDFLAYENDDELPAVTGNVSGVIDGATVILGQGPVSIDPDALRHTLGLSSGNLDSQLDALGELIADVDSHLDDQDGTLSDLADDLSALAGLIHDLESHGDMNWSQTAAASEIATLVSSMLASTRKIVVEIPLVYGSHLKPPLVQGSSYLHQYGRSLPFSRSGIADIPEGTDVVLRARGSGTDGARQFQIPGIVITRSGTTKTVRFDVTSEQSAEWVPGKYEFQIDLIFPHEPGDTPDSFPFFGPGYCLEVLPSIPSS
ncbi:MAG TPA: hypothetical protein VNQ76_09265 [Planctomicrobium sp.]|nr:hypothetical protein [Planctomicrobium sp.]